MRDSVAAMTWSGYRLGPWWRVLADGRFRVRPSRLPLAVLTTVAAGLNSLRYAAQTVRFGTRLRAMEPASLPSPVFIIGHWRSGTTLLHTLLSLDRRFGCPTSEQCFFPCSIASRAPLMRFWTRWLMPSTRPMDSMDVGVGSPQEDEFALAALGAPSPYSRIAFPKDMPTWDDLLDIDSLPPVLRRRWERTFARLVGLLSLGDPRPLLLKSPTHTCRIPVLRAMFPQARFLHIVRTPREVIPSTCNLWRQMVPIMAFQRSRLDVLDDHVFATYRHVMRRVSETAVLSPPGHYHEVRFENLVERPLETLAAAYDALGLGDFGRALEPGVRAWREDHAGYRPRQWVNDAPALQQRITRECAEVMTAYGYP